LSLRSGCAFIGFVVVAGCSLDETGLRGQQDGETLDAFDELITTNDASTDATAMDVTTDAHPDVAIDAPPDAPFDAGSEAGPIVTITGGPYTLLDLDAGCSLNSNVATSFVLTNDRDASVDLVWVDFGCAEQPYGTIAPLGMHNQGTYVTHVWRIRNDADKAFLASFVLNSSATYSVTVH
jgi:hypothetical protein